MIWTSIEALDILLVEREVDDLDKFEENDEMKAREDRPELKGRNERDWKAGEVNR